MFDSFIRTLVPLVVGLLLTQAAAHGLNLTGSVITDLVTVALTSAYYLAARVVEQHFPWLGRLLVSASLSQRSPVYLKPEGQAA